MRTIDVQHHIFPRSYMKELISLGLGENLRGIWAEKAADDNVEKRLKDMDRYGIDVGVLTLATPAVDSFEDPKTAIRLARLANDDLAKLPERYPDRFVGFAALPLQDPSAAVDELERAVKDLGYVGLGLQTEFGDKWLDSPEFYPIFEKAQKYDLPIFVHPSGYGARYSSKNGELHHNFGGNLSYGWPFHSTIALHRIVYSGLLEAYPNLKFISAHLGGTIAFYSERTNALVYNWMSNNKQIVGKLRKRPYEYFKKIFYDTATYYEPGLRMVHEYVGSDQIVFGTDYPYGPEAGTYAFWSAVSTVKNANLPAEDKEKIFHKNAEKMLKIK